MRVAVIFESQKALVIRVKASPIASNNRDIADRFRRKSSVPQVAKANLRQFLVFEIHEVGEATYLAGPHHPGEACAINPWPIAPTKGVYPKGGARARLRQADVTEAVQFGYPAERIERRALRSDS
jgi:hypothetical protein